MVFLFSSRLAAPCLTFFCHNPSFLYIIKISAFPLSYFFSKSLNHSFSSGMLISKAVLSGRIQQKSWNLNSQTPLWVSYVIKVLLSYQICVSKVSTHTVPVGYQKSFTIQSKQWQTEILSVLMSSLCVRCDNHSSEFWPGASEGVYFVCDGHRSSRRAAHWNLSDHSADLRSEWQRPQVWKQPLPVWVPSRLLPVT